MHTEVPDIFWKRLRSNPDYDCILFDRLPSPVQSNLVGLRDDPNLFGILRSTTGRLTIKSVDRDIALLFFSLREPGQIPDYARRSLGARCNDVIISLILDGVFEIEWSLDTFVSGPQFRDVAAEIFERGEVLGQSESLEISALKSAEGAGLTEVGAIAAWLYTYNQLPISSRWRLWFQQFDEGVSLGTLMGGYVPQQILKSSWQSTLNEDWLMYTRIRDDGWANRTVRAKLYISPQPEYLPDAVPEVIEVCTQLGAGAFKIGRTLPNLLRPDKLIAYWGTVDEACNAGLQLVTRIGGLRGHRVPFTARIENSDVVSWGIDPPHREVIVPWQSPSWRGWVIEKLARALSAAQGDTSLRRAPWEYALWRVHQEGVDVDAWVPNPRSWEQPVE